MKKTLAILVIALFFGLCIGALVSCGGSRNLKQSTPTSMEVDCGDTIIIVDIQCDEKTRQQIRQEERTKRQAAEEETERLKLELDNALKLEKEAGKQAKADAALQLKILDREYKELKLEYNHYQTYWQHQLDSLENENKTLQKLNKQNTNLAKKESDNERKVAENDSDNKRKASNVENRSKSWGWIVLAYFLGVLSWMIFQALKKWVTPVIFKLLKK